MSTEDPRVFYNEVMPNKFGRDYEHERWHKNPIQEAGYAMTRDAIVRHVLEDEKIPIRVIELGPGAATWTRLLMKQFPDAEYTLVDISREMLERAEETISRAYPSVHISYKESDILEYADTRQCDLFFSSRVLEYIEDKKAFTEKVAELLAHGGKGFIITKMPHYDRDEMLGRKAARFHLGQITPEALVGLLEEAGLSVEGAYPVTLSFPQVRIPGLNLLLAKIFAGSPVSLLSSFFAESYCVVFSKE